MDKKEKRAVDTKEGEDLARRYGAQFCELSSLSRSGVDVPLHQLSATVVHSANGQMEHEVNGWMQGRSPGDVFEMSSSAGYSSAQEWTPILVCTPSARAHLTLSKAQPMPNPGLASV